MNHRTPIDIKGFDKSLLEVFKKDNERTLYNRKNKTLPFSLVGSSTNNNEFTYEFNNEFTQA